MLCSQWFSFTGLLYMVLKHLVDRYNIYFAYGPSKISQSIHETAINCVIVSLVLLQMSFMSLSFLRRGLHDITIFSLAGFVVTVVCLLAHIFLNCCKGFSPITYTRVSLFSRLYERCIVFQVWILVLYIPSLTFSCILLSANLSWKLIAEIKAKSKWIYPSTLHSSSTFCAICPATFLWL